MSTHSPGASRAAPVHESNLLDLQSSFQGGGVVVAAAEEQQADLVHQVLRQLLHLVVQQ